MLASAVVLDTNVLVAAGFNPRSASAKIVEAVKQGELRMVWNEETRREIEHIMQQIPPLRGHDMSELFRPEDRYIAPTHPERFTSIPDPDDRKFAALAHAAGATLISNDDHLLRHRDRMDVPVLTPHEFWNRHQCSNHAQGRT
jgi:predicted nucleic acid-binding protein